jgi:hypothetical protein
LCLSSCGPSFGNFELLIDEPFLGEGKVSSVVGESGFMIGGKIGDIHPLTGDIIHNERGSGPPCGKGTLKELEVWSLKMEEWGGPRER